MSEPESLGKIISHGLMPAPGKKKLKLEIITLNWRHIAGERLASHGTPTRLARGTVYVSADGPSWAAELCTETPALLAGIGRVLGDGSVRKIRVQARDWAPGEAGEATGGAATDKKEGAELGDQIRKKLAGIEEEETRRALEGMLRASITTKQSKHND